MLNFWKDHKQNNNQTLSSWMTPTALANNLSSQSSAAWQPIPNSAAFKSIRNGNTGLRKTLDDLKNRPFYGVRPTSNVHLNNNSLASNNCNISKPLNYSHYFNETGDRTLHSLRNPLMYPLAPFLRDNLT